MWIARCRLHVAENRMQVAYKYGSFKYSGKVKEDEEM